MILVKNIVRGNPNCLRLGYFYLLPHVIDDALGQDNDASNEGYDNPWFNCVADGFIVPAKHTIQGLKEP